MNEFWHTIDELEPPIGKTVWTTTDPFKNIPVIRADSWSGPGTGGDIMGLEERSIGLFQ